MSWFTTTLLLIGCLSFVAGYLRLITDDNGNVNLNNYRFTGGLGMVLTGFGNGVRDLVVRDWTDEAQSAMLMVGGAVVAALGVWSA